MLSRLFACFAGKTENAMTKKNLKISGVRLANLCKEHGVLFLGQLLGKTQEDILGWPGASARTIEEIHAALRRAGYLGAEGELPRRAPPAEESEPAKVREKEKGVSGSLFVCFVCFAGQQQES